MRTYDLAFECFEGKAKLIPYSDHFLKYTASIIVYHTVHTLKY